jgi:hypothetical protein
MNVVIFYVLNTLKCCNATFDKLYIFILMM